jgi:hypothetical protein
MTAGNKQRQKPKASPVELAIGAVEGATNPLDADMTRIDPDPTSLDLDNGEDAKMCSHPHCVCAVCGSPLGADRS